MFRYAHRLAAKMYEQDGQFTCNLLLWRVGLMFVPPHISYESYTTAASDERAFQDD
jgi:hypothetical protein